MAHSNGQPRARLPFPSPCLKHITATLIAIAVGISMYPAAGHLSARPGGEDSSSLLVNAQARPVSLAAADFDADGVSDLLAGYATADGGMLVLHRGNVDALYPNTPEARARRLAGQFTSSPFLPGPRALSLPAAPDFLHTGDFDADGHFDAIAAAAGGAAVVLRGDGTGVFGAAEPIDLPGAVTAVAVGDINGPDGRADVVIAVTAEKTSRLLVFAGYDGAWRTARAVFELAAPATALALGRLDNNHIGDIAVAAGDELLVVHGREGRPGANRGRAVLTPVERQQMPFTIQSLTVRDLTGDRRSDLAAVASAGAVHVLAEGVASNLTVVNRPSGPGNVAAISGQDPSARTAETTLDAVAVLPMRLDIDARDDLVVLRAGDTAPTFVTTLAATTRMVTNTNDSGRGSLRQAILDSNASVGDDLIAFDIPGPGPHTIAPITALPVIKPDSLDGTGAVVIDGTTEPDYAGTPIVELSGALAGGSLVFGGDASVVRGLAINRFPAGLVFSYEFGGTANGGLVEGNYIGTDHTGTTALGNGAGIQLGTGAQVGISVDVTIGGTAAPARNVISGNGTGIQVYGAAHTIQGNYIGTDAAGTAPLGNRGPGLSLVTSASIEVGGLTPGAGNLISANEGPGFTFFESGPILISGNFIGTDASGEQALGNGSHGIDAPDSGMTISGNVISGNAGYGIFAPSVLAALEVVDNRIGTNSAGTAALGNGLSGVEVNSHGHTIRGNVISGNGMHGIMLRGLQNRFQQNRVGTDITGTVPLGNGGDGVQVLDLDNTIGGDGNGNVIAFNGGRGVAIELSFPTFVPILSNAIFSNGGLGIDLGGDGPTPNDACDADEHANSPVLTAATSSVSGTTVTGSLNSRPNFSHVLQFFASADADPSGFGEGATLLGSTTVVTDAACNASFTATLPVPVPANHFVTSTATIVITNGFVQMATSEFSNAIRFVPETSEDAIRALMTQVGDLVAQGELNGLAGFVLTIKLQAALFFVERDLPRVAAVQLRGFSQIVELLVKFRQLDPAHGQALVDAARAIIAGLEGT